MNNDQTNKQNPILTILGTGNALVKKCYNTCFAVTDNHQTFLVDGGGGNGILRQLEDAQLKVEDIHDIFVTHKHVDHIMGIIWLIRIIGTSMNKGTYKGEARIYAHAELISTIRMLAEALLQKKQTAAFDKTLHLIPVEDGQTVEILNRPVTFFNIQSTKAKQFGFSMAITPDKKLTCCGDEPFKECERSYAQDSKWLMHEAFCLYAQADRFHPYDLHHSTVREACETGESLHVENLILYHTEEENLQNRRELYTKEGKQYFTGNLIVPNDLDKIELV